MLLEGKNAVIYGGAGSIGGAVARAFAAEGARVFLSGRTLDALETVVEDIRESDGMAQASVVDALDEEAVDAFTDGVVTEAGSIDISFNAISVGDVQGTPMIEMTLGDYEAPILNTVRSFFLTSRAAARHMVKAGGGVILVFGGDGDPVRDYSIGGFQTSLQAMEAMRRQLSAELGKSGVRVVTMKTGGIPESLADDDAGRERITEMLEKDTLLGRTATLKDVGEVAAFVASDKARTMTAATVNVSAGALVD